MRGSLLRVAKFALGLRYISCVHNFKLSKKLANASQAPLAMVWGFPGHRLWGSLSKQAHGEVWPRMLLAGG